MVDSLAQRQLDNEDVMCQFMKRNCYKVTKTYKEVVASPDYLSFIEIIRTPLYYYLTVTRCIKIKYGNDQVESEYSTWSFHIRTIFPYEN